MSEDFSTAADMLLSDNAPSGETKEEAPQSVAKENNNSGENTSPTWADGFADDYKEMVKNKGWGAAEDALKSYKSLEQLLGADRAGRTVVLPKGEDDTEARDKIYKAMGMPEKAEDYQLNKIWEGQEVNAELVGSMQNTFKEAGLSTSQAKTIGEAYKKIETENMAAMRARDMEQIKSLKDQWGAEYETKLAMGKKAVRQFGEVSGLGPNELKHMEEYFGSGAVLRHFATVGEALMEDNFKSSNSSANVINTVEQADDEINRLQSNPEFVANYLKGNKRENDMMDKLFKVKVNSK